MTPRTLGLTDPLHEYLLQVGFREHSALKRIREETARHPGVNTLLAPEQAHFMALLAQLLGVLEIGTYTGYSALAIALALEPEGKVLELRLGPALVTLDALLTQGERGRFDM